ncbi:MAG: hypothetical protein ABIJ56_04120 [Pseudomonadota bacterium]
MGRERLSCPFLVILLFLSPASCGTKDLEIIYYDGTTDILLPECIDNDGDGHGIGCPGGEDCNDNDPEHWSDCPDCEATHAEGCECSAGESYDCYDGPTGTLDIGQCSGGTRSCVDGRLGPCEGQVLPDDLEDCEDGVDNNCNGETDEAWICGDCAPPCYTDGTREPSSSDSGSTGLAPNPDGPGVVLGEGEDEEGGFAWIANCVDGNVSKLDILTGAEVGRYEVGLAGSHSDSPSRTAVDDYQAAYVGNRGFFGQGSVTKIAGFERYCVDRNGDGDIDTSRGPEYLPLGEDECVLWTVELGEEDAIPRAVVVDFGGLDVLGGYPWVGCFNELRFYKLDPDDGSILNHVDINVHPYGAAIDSAGWIWVSGRESYQIQRFNYVSREVEPPVSVPSSCGGNNPYGIAVDREDRVWIGVWDNGGACRYDPATGSWLFVNTGGRTRGIAVDEDNVVWATNDVDAMLYRFNADDGSGLASFAVDGITPVGVGADRFGKVWVVNHESHNTVRFDKATERFDGPFPTGSFPYTYSDFLGYQRYLMNPRGVWVNSFERCDEKEGDKWLQIVWNTETPADSRITIKGRSSNISTELSTAPEVVIASIGPDPDVGGVDLERVFSEAGTPIGKYLEVTVILEAGSIETVSPVFRSIQVFYYCESLE